MECIAKINTNELFAQHAPTFQRLYVTERKKLADVKKEMEVKYNFPILPISIYETRLRNLLRLRKKLKKTDWPIISQHYHSRKRAGKKTMYYIHGARWSEEQIWKEIRRSGNAKMSQSRHNLSPLPDGVEMRTPSLTPQSYALVPATDMSNMSPPMPNLSLTRKEYLAKNPDFVMSLSTTGPLPGETTAEWTDWVHWLCSETIPFRFFLSRIACMVGHCLHGPEAAAVMNNNGFNSTANTSMPSADLQRLLLSLVHRPFCRTQQPHSESAVLPNFDVYHFLAKLIFALSNNVKNEIGKNIFEIISDRLPEKFLVDFFLLGDMPSVRSAWEKLVRLAGAHQRKIIFELLIAIGLKRPVWLKGDASRILSYAASMGCVKLIQEILKAGVDLTRQETDPSSPFLEALAARDLACAEMILRSLKRYDTVINDQPSNTVKQHLLDQLLLHLVFGKFYESVAIDSAGSRLPGSGPCHQPLRFDLENDVHSKGLEMLLLDSHVHVDLASRLSAEGIRYRGEISLDEMYEYDADRPTIAEWCFYRDEKVFGRVIKYSTRPATDMTRYGICIAAREGKKALQEYVVSRMPVHDAGTIKFLQLVFVEQFMLRDGRFDLPVISTLVDYGVDPSLPGLDQDASDLLRLFLLNVEREGLNEDVEEIIRLLFRHGATVDEFILRAAVRSICYDEDDKDEDEGEEEEYGTRKGISPLLSLLVASIPRSQMPHTGARALVEAAHESRFDVVDFLLQSGADINADVSDIHYGGESLSVLASSISYFRLGDGGLPAFDMAELLIQRGAELRVNQQTPDPLKLLEFVVRELGNEMELLNKMHIFLVPGGINLDHASSSLLESCLQPARFRYEPLEVPRQRLELFEWFYRQGVPIDCSLAVLIYRHGKPELIQELLAKGADVNAYSGAYLPDDDYRAAYRFTPIQAAAAIGDHQLVENLLHRGANINAPAHRMRGKTAIQAACSWSTVSEEEHRRKHHLVDFLIKQGADINAPPTNHHGFTALHEASVRGDPETVRLLLLHRANVNVASTWDPDMDYPLDLAAYSGRLDVVKLLLNHGAQSCRPGSTLYDGAIAEAERYGHHTVADLIRKHAEDNNVISLEDFNLVASQCMLNTLLSTSGVSQDGVLASWASPCL